MNVVAQFVRQNGLDLVGCELIQQGIPKNDALGIAQSCQSRVGGFCPAAHVEFVNAAHMSPGLFCQADQASFEIGVVIF